MKARQQVRRSAAITNDFDDIVKDAVALFTGETQGHMERWEYGASLFPHDPAGGSDYWADLVRRPGRYYLTKGDTDAIQWAVTQKEFLEAVSDVESVLELGPGSREAIIQKTVPFLKVCPHLKSYTAIDATVEQAANAANIIGGLLTVESHTHCQNYVSAPLKAKANGKSALVMWGSSLGNIDGRANENASSKLIKAIKNFGNALKSGDLVILCCDTENDERKILNAYSEPSLRAQILSVLYRLKRDGQIVGNFDPRVWRHEPAWFSEVGQCAHMIYPIFDQTLTFAGLTIEVPAWHRFVSNNSYKFSPSTVTSAIESSGLVPLACFQNGPVALFVAKSR